MLPAPAPESVAVADFDEDEYEDEEEMDEGGEASTDEELNMRMFGIQQALPVTGEPDWDEEEADSAMEYLRRVQHERAQLPAIIRVEPSEGPPAAGGPADAAAPSAHHAASQPGGGGSGAPAAPAWCAMDGAWLAQLTRQFEALRLQLQRLEGQLAGRPPARQLPKVSDTEAWNALCFPATPAAGAGGAGARAAASSSDDAGGPSCMSAGGPADMLAAAGVSGDMYEVLMSMDQVAVATLLQQHVRALVRRHPGAPPPARAAWLFALAARMGKPLLPDVAASLRALATHCAAARAALPGGAADPGLPPLSVLLAVAGGYFGQEEGLCRRLGVPDFQELA